MAKELPGAKPRRCDLAADFTGSMRTQDPKLALNIMAEAFNVGLAPGPTRRCGRSRPTPTWTWPPNWRPCPQCSSCAALAATPKPTAPTWARCCAC